MKALFTALLLAAALPAHLQAQTQAQTQAPLSDAQVCSRPSQNFEQIIRSCSRALDGAGSDDEYRAGILQLRAIAYAKKGDPDRAIADLDAVIKLQPKSAGAYAIRAQQWQTRHLDRNAIADYDAAIRLEGEKPLTLLRRSMSYGALKEDPQALADLDRALQLDPGYTSAQIARGMLKHRMGDFAGAIADFDAALKADPGSQFVIDYRAKSVAARAAGPVPGNSQWEEAMAAGRDATRRRDRAAAERAYEAALTRLPDPQNKDLERLAETLGALINVKLRLAKYEDAERLARQALALDERRVGPDNDIVGLRLVTLAEVIRLRGQPAQALKISRRALAIHEKNPGPSSKNLVFSLSEVAQDLHSLGNYREAEATYRRALAVTEQAFGEDSSTIAVLLNGLAVLLHDQGRAAETPPLYRRAIAITAKQYGADNPEVAEQIGNFALVLVEQGEIAEAERLTRQVLAILEKAYGPSHPGVAHAQVSLAGIYGRTQRHAEEEALLKRALPVLRQTLGPEHPETISAMINLGGSYYNQKRAAEALPLFVHATEIARRVYGPEGPQVSFALYWQSFAYADLGDAQQALETARGASAISMRRNSLRADEMSEAARSEQRTYVLRYRHHIDAIFGMQAPFPQRFQALAPEAFQMFQATRASDTAGAIASMAARFARGDGELARLVRARQDTLSRRQEVDTALLRASTLAPEKRNQSDEKAQRAEVQALEVKAAELSGALEAKFPEYKVLTSAEPVALAETQALLGENEALLSYVVGPERSFMLVVRRRQTLLAPLPLGRAALAERVAALRRTLDPADGGMRPFPMDAAHELYKLVFAPAAGALQGVEHIMVVPDGPLASLPMGLLIAAPAPDDRQAGAYARAEWLAKKYAFSTLPSEASLRALRVFAKRAAGDDPFQGFGNPVLEGQGSARGGAQLAKMMPRGGVADVTEVRKLAPLPETALELGAFARLLGASAQSVHTGAAATETNVKRMDLSRSRVVAFATHGLVAGDFDNLLEPALALTPPAKGSELDDGLLTASEIAQLRLNADWVILSACNTAASDGSPGGEGLSGLAKAFFYAGSRTLVVSHWPVASGPTVLLTTRMFRESVAPGVGKAEALRRSMLALINDAQHPELAHPIFWAPFVIVGEGGAAK